MPRKKGGYTGRFCKNCWKWFSCENYRAKAGRGKFCSRHCRAVAVGRISKPRPFSDAELRLWLRVKSSKDGCWNWLDAVNSQGYGELRVNRRTTKAHRFSWELHFGQICDGLLVCHKCDNRRCVRPDHLFLGTNTDNMRDMVAKHRHTGSGPKLTEEDARRIYLLRNTGVTRVEVANLFGVRKGTITDIWTGRTWAKLATEQLLVLAEKVERTNG